VPPSARLETGPKTLSASCAASVYYPVTPDGRYMVVRGRLWRRTNPNLSGERRLALLGDLGRARASLRAARPAGGTLADAGAAVDRAGAGERGPVWWADGAPDFNRHLVKNTPMRRGSRRCRNLSSRPDSPVALAGWTRRGSVLACEGSVMPAARLLHPLEGRAAPQLWPQQDDHLRGSTAREPRGRTRLRPGSEGLPYFSRHSASSRRSSSDTGSISRCWREARAGEE